MSGVGSSAFAAIWLPGWASTVWVSFTLPRAIVSGKVRASRVGIDTAREFVAVWSRNPPGIGVVLLIIWPLIAYAMLLIVWALARGYWQDRTLLRRKCRVSRERGPVSAGHRMAARESMSCGDRRR